MKKILRLVFVLLALFLASPERARAASLEEVLAFYAQGAGSGMEAIATALTMSAHHLANAALPATGAAMAEAETVAIGIAEVLRIDPAIRHVLTQRAIFLGNNLGLRGDAFLSALRNPNNYRGLGQRAANLGQRGGAASVDALVTVAGLAIVAGITGYTIYEGYLAYDAGVQSESVDQEAYNNNVALLLDRLTSGRHGLCPGVSIPQALEAVRSNGDAGLMPYSGVLEECETVDLDASCQDAPDEETRLMCECLNRLDRISGNWTPETSWTPETTLDMSRDWWRSAQRACDAAASDGG